MADAWYYMDNGNQVGPVGAAQLKQLVAAGRLHHDTSVWKEGLTEWIPASKLKGLFNSPQTPPPPPPRSTQQPAPAPMQTAQMHSQAPQAAAPTAQMETCRHCGKPYTAGLRTCPYCKKGTLRAGQAYGTFNLKKGGFGAFDLIPGVRDLPPVVKIILIAIVVGGILIFILPLFGR